MCGGGLIEITDWGTGSRAGYCIVDHLLQATGVCVGGGYNLNLKHAGSVEATGGGLTAGYSIDEINLLQVQVRVCMRVWG